MITNFASLVFEFIDIISLLIQLVFAVTFIVIIWKMIDAWIIHAGDSAKIEEGKHTVLVGIIALVVMLSIWGILQILKDSLF